MRQGRLPTLVLLGLAAAILASGTLLAHARHEHRAQFQAVQALIAERDGLEVEWGALQLERAASVRYLRIDREARERLGMREPERADLVFLRLKSPRTPPPRTNPGEL